MIFDLVRDFADALEAMPKEHPRHRLLKLLDEAIRRDIHFIARHRDDYPQALFQCAWNNGWWYDCPQALRHYSGGLSPGQKEGLRLHGLLEGWREDRERRAPGFLWVRSLRPPREHLGIALKAILSGHTARVWSVAFTHDGERLVSGSWDGTVRVWDRASCSQTTDL